MKNLKSHITLHNFLAVVALVLIFGTANISRQPSHLNQLPKMEDQTELLEAAENEHNQLMESTHFDLATEKRISYLEGVIFGLNNAKN